MPVRFRKTIKISPWVKMNLSKSGVSFTIGKKGYHLNFGKQGVKQTIGLPGTGISHVSYIGKDDGDDDKKEKNGNGDEENILGELGKVAGMAAMAAVMKENDDEDDDKEGESRAATRTRKRARKRKREDKDRSSSALRSTFILFSVLVFFVVGAAMLGLIPGDFLSNIGHTLVQWARQFGR